MNGGDWSDPCGRCGHVRLHHRPLCAHQSGWPYTEGPCRCQGFVAAGDNVR